MRASSLSNAKVIDLLNGYFVPVYLRNEDFADDGSASKQEKSERNRIYREALAAGLPAGSVCAYLVSPDARPIDVAPLNQSVATDPQRLAEKMERVISDLKVTKGKPLVRPIPQSAAPACDSESLALHLTARYLDKSANGLVPFDVKSVLGTQKAGNWGNLPSEDWVVLSKPEWTTLLPPGNIHSGATWELNAAVAGQFLKRFFPPTENTNFEKNLITQQELTGRIGSVQDGVAQARISGRLKMKHPFYHKDDNNFVEATLVGLIDFQVDKQRIRSLRLVTDQATYGSSSSSSQIFGAALRSTP